MLKPIRLFTISVLAVAAAFVLPALAAPSMCANSTARAVKLLGNGPAACALNSCRAIGTQTSKVVTCSGSDPGCANDFPYVEVWKAAAGSWAGLPACPTWTNTSTWQ